MRDLQRFLKLKDRFDSGTAFEVGYLNKIEQFFV